MRYRQVHLDFHTSERIPGIGSRFDADAFATAFADANVDSVTIFAKCHHGWSYHPTKVGKQHPNLDFDLTRAQLDALHKRGINAPIYISAGWDELAAREHAEWRVVSPEGDLVRMRAPPHGAGWAFLDFGSPYLDHLCNQIDEVMELFPDGDGVFIDICFQLVSVNAWSQAAMEARGLDWTNPDHRLDYTEEVQVNFYERVVGTVRKHDAETPLFFNFGHVRRGRRDMLTYYTHLEVESLPTGGWGYDHFPTSARYFEPLGIDFLGMTGKFHHSWGEVGGYKKPEALIYECAAMLAQGARCSIGDHLHPTGAVDQTTYQTIGAAYAYVKACEPWAEGSRNVAEIGVVSTEAAARPRLIGIPEHHDDADEGALRVLLESSFTFDLLDFECDLGAYRLLILPDSIKVTPEIKSRIDTFVAAGGRVLLTGMSGIDSEKGFVLDVGAEWLGHSPFHGGDYLLPGESLRASFVGDPLFMYEPSERIRVTNGQSLGAIYEPYFDRTPVHFSGHRNTPNQPEPSGYDAGVESNGFFYLAHPLFSTYKRVGAVAMLEIAEKAIARALGRRRLVETSLPRAGRVTLRRQADQRRYVLHLLHATPALRGNIQGGNVQPIQDLVTLRDVSVDVGIDASAKVVRMAPSGEELEFSATDGRVRFSVPELTGQQLVEIAF